MSDWKSEFDKKIQDEENEKNRKENERRARSDNECEQRRLQAESIVEKKKAEHYVKFRCAICDKPSDGPLGDYEEDTGGFDREGSRYSNISTNEGPHWDTPTGLFWCRHCNKYYCEDHFHMGRCQTCARNT